MQDARKQTREKGLQTDMARGAVDVNGGHLVQDQRTGILLSLIHILFAKMYEDWSAGRITEYNFNMLSEKYQNEQKELETSSCMVCRWNKSAAKCIHFSEWTDFSCVTIIICIAAACKART